MGTAALDLEPSIVGMTGRPRRWRGLAALMCCGAGLFASGCSIAVPMGSFTGDATPTGSVERQAKVLSGSLDQEDWRRAKAALAVALDPQGNGALASWANPATGARGSFTASAPPRSDGDRICRAFRARVAPKGRAEREVAGSACRDGSGEWNVAAVTSSKGAEG